GLRTQHTDAGQLVEGDRDRLGQVSQLPGQFTDLVVGRLRDRRKPCGRRLLPAEDIPHAGESRDRRLRHVPHGDLYVPQNRADAEQRVIQPIRPLGRLPRRPVQFPLRSHHLVSEPLHRAQRRSRGLLRLREAASTVDRSLLVSIEPVVLRVQLTEPRGDRIVRTGLISTEPPVLPLNLGQRVLLPCQGLHLAAHGAQSTGGDPCVLRSPVGRLAVLLRRLGPCTEGRRTLLHALAKALRSLRSALGRGGSSVGSSSERLRHVADRCRRPLRLLKFIAKSPYSRTERACCTGSLTAGLDELADVGRDTSLGLEASSHPDLLSLLSEE